MIVQAPNEPLRLVDRLADVERALLQRGANTVQHSRWSLQVHLVGTFELLEYWRQREALCLAGLLHSAYSTDAFRRGVFDIEERAFVRDIIGEEAECLAFLFCSIRRDELIESIRVNARSRTGDLTVDSWRDGRTLTVTPSQVGDLLLLHLANIAEQSCATDSSPSPWLAAASELACYAAAFSSNVPTIFSGCTARIDIADEDRLVGVYGLATSPAAERASHIDQALRRAAEAVGAVGEPFVWLGLLALSRGDFRSGLVSRRAFVEPARRMGGRMGQAALVRAVASHCSLFA
jgi:hypothetical protein